MTTLFALAARLQAAGAIEAMLLVIAKATVILAIARVLLMAMPRASAAAKHLVATVALVAVAAMPVMAFLMPAWTIVVEEKAAPAAAEAGRVAAAPKTVGATDTEDSGPSTFGTAISVARATGIVPDEPLTAMNRAMKVAGASWKGMIALLLALGTGLLMLQMLAGIAGVWHVARHARALDDPHVLAQLEEARSILGLRRAVRLLGSPRISVPVIWGFFRPVLLLPTDAPSWPAERLRVVLLHELAHLVRYDGIFLIVTRIASSVFWYHPLAWSLERAGRNECERACDDLVLASGTRPSEYADHLLAIARSMPTFDPFRSVTLAMSRKSQLEGRLLSILQPAAVRRAFSGRGLVIASALAVAVIIPVAALRVTAKPPGAEEVAQAKEESRSARRDRSVSRVEDDVEAIGDFVLATLGRYDRRADRLMREPKTAEDWHERAWNLYRSERYAEAAEAFQRAARDGYEPARSLYNAACSRALLGDAAGATRELSAAIEAGWDDFEHIADDSDFDPIRRDPAFARLVDAGGGDIATRRVERTVERYEAMKQGKAVTKSDAPATLDQTITGILGREKKESWFEVGLDLLRLRQLDPSIDAFQQAIAAGERPATSMYNIACAYALGGDAANGLAWLDRAIEHGFSGEERLQNDPDIASLRGHPEFAGLVEKAADLEMKGCCDRPWGDGERSSWAAATAHHRQIAAKYPRSGRAWFNVGYTALQARDFATATDAFRRTIDLGYRTGTASYNMACAFALQGNRDAAFEWLEKAQAARFDLGAQMDGDDDLDALHHDPRWKTLREKAGADQPRWLKHLKEHG